MKQGSVILRVHVYIILRLFYCSRSQKTVNFYWTKNIFALCLLWRFVHF